MFGKINLDKQSRKALIELVEKQHAENTELLKKEVLKFDNVIRCCVTNEVKKQLELINSEKKQL